MHLRVLHNYCAATGIGIVIYYGLLIALRMWPTSVSESNVLRFLKQGSKFIAIKLAADGKICGVFLLMFDYNGKETDARTKLYLPFTVRY
jgi:hypothetical protein